jgi:hypothetical protein
VSQFQNVRVVADDGTPLGHLMDFRCGSAPDKQRVQQSVPIDTLVYGVRGWLERLGLRQAKECEVAWRDVLRFERGRLVVRAPRGKRKRKR